MKQVFVTVLVSVLLFSCSNEKGKGKFTVTGDIKGGNNQKVFLEELFFSDKPVEVLDTAVLKDGKFSVSAIAKEEGLYRLRVENSEKIGFDVIDVRSGTRRRSSCRSGPSDP